jgi:hypothetical protein
MQVMVLAVAAHRGDLVDPDPAAAVARALQPTQAVGAHVEA